MVPREGIEPSRYCYHRILSPARLPIPPPRRENGVSETNRTSDPLINSQLLHRLSYGDIPWCRLQDLNPQPIDYKSTGRSVELHRKMVEANGIEPPTPCL